MKIGIIGAGLGGLLSGAILSKEHSVTIYEKLPFVGGRFTNIPYKGFQLTTGALHMIPHGNDGYLAQTLRRAGSSVKIVNSVPDGYFRINGKNHEYKDILGLLPTKEKLKGIKLAANLKLGKIDKNMPFGEFLEDIPLALAVGNSFSGWALSLNAYDTPMSEIMEISRLYHKFGGPGIPVGGCKGVIDSLVEIINKNGGKIYTNHAVEKIEVEESNAFIDLEHFDIVISNASPKLTENMSNIKFIEKEPVPSKGIKINVASKSSLVDGASVIFTTDCERINGLNQPSNVDGSLAKEDYNLIMLHATQLKNNTKEEINLALNDVESLFGGKDYEVISIQSYGNGWPVNHASNGTDLNPIVRDNLLLVGDGVKGIGGIEVEGVAMSVMTVLEHIEKLKK
ncbi:NAD(P)-binding protein [Methanococcus sp. CF]